MKAYRHRAYKCPGCGKLLDACTQVSPNGTKHTGKPKPGDLSVCINCGQPLRWRHNLKLEPVSTWDLAQLERSDPVCYHLVERMMRLAPDLWREVTGGGDSLDTR